MKRYSVRIQLEGRPDFRVLTAHPALTPGAALVDGIQKYERAYYHPGEKIEGASVTEDES